MLHAEWVATRFAVHRPLNSIHAERILVDGVVHQPEDIACLGRNVLELVSLSLHLKCDFERL